MKLDLLDDESGGHFVHYLRMKLSTDRIVSLSAMVVGIASLFIITYQTYLMREAQAASVLPYLMVGFDSNSQGAFVMLKNQGVGPAIIEDVKVHYEGRVVNADPFDFYVGIRPDVNAGAIDVAKIQPGRLISDGESLRMIGVDPEVAGKELHGFILDDLLKLFDIAEVPKAWLVPRGAVGTRKAVIEITYKSIYGDRWRIRSDRLVPEEL
jgi:hypothetical protein